MQLLDNNKKSNNSAFAIKFGGMVVVLLFFCLAECAAGSCIHYGHACWGAHGKRSYSGDKEIKKDFSNMDWFLAKLSRPDLRFIRPEHIPIQNERKEIPLSMIPENFNALDAFGGHKVLRGFDPELEKKYFDEKFDESENSRTNLAGENFLGAA